MKKKASLYLIPLFLLISGCESPDERDFSRGEREVSRSEFKDAMDQFDRVMRRSPDSPLGLKAAREAARVAYFEAKNFEKAAEYYRHLILNSKDSTERLTSQKQLVVVYFDHLNDYPKAILEINRLMALLPDDGSRVTYKMMLARAYYYQNNFEQALNEAGEFLRHTKNATEKFEMLMLKGNVLLAKKDLAQAARVFQDMMKEFPKESQKENIGLTAALCFEEMGDFKNAILALKDVRDHHPTPEYIDLRIQRLEERQRNLPGARGFRK